MNAILLIYFLINSDFDAKTIVIKQNYTECTGSVILPPGVTLDFQGGSLSAPEGRSASIIGNNTVLKGDVLIASNINLAGTWILNDTILVEDITDPGIAVVEDKWKKLTIQNNIGNPTVLYVLTGRTVTVYTVTLMNENQVAYQFSSNEGTLVNLNTYTLSKSGYNFDGWFTSEGIKLTSITVNGNITLYAHFSEKPEYQYALSTTPSFDSALSSTSNLTSTLGSLENWNSWRDLENQYFIFNTKNSSTNSTDYFELKDQFGNSLSNNILNPEVISNPRISFEWIGTAPLSLNDSTATIKFKD